MEGGYRSLLRRVDRGRCLGEGVKGEGRKLLLKGLTRLAFGEHGTGDPEHRKAA